MTDPDSRSPELAPDRVVGTVMNEVDHYTPGGEAGWSVAIMGRAEEVDDDAEIQHFSHARGVLWGEGRRTHWIRIVPSKITGCEIQAMPSPRDSGA